MSSVPELKTIKFTSHLELAMGISRSRLEDKEAHVAEG